MTAYFDVLGVDRTASDEEIKEAFQEQSKRYHPDGSVDHPEPAQLFSDIKQAKEGLIGDGPRRTKPSPNNHPSRPSAQLNYQWDGGEPTQPTTTAGEGPTVNDDNSETEESSSDNEGWSSDPSADPSQRERTRATVGDDSSSDSTKNQRDAESEAGTGAREETGDETDDRQEQTSDDGEEDEGYGRREVLKVGGVVAGSAIIANQFGLLGLGTSGQGTPETVEVEPTDSIQDAIGQVAEGGTIEMSPGRYEQSITIDKSLSLIAPDGATLDGRSAGDAPGIELAAGSVAIEGLDIIEFVDFGIKSIVTNREVRITNSTVSQIDGKGIEIDSRSATISGTAIQDCEDTGIHIKSPAQGDITIENATVERSTRDIGIVADNRGHGIAVSGGQDISVANSELLDNGGNNLHLEPSEAREQSIEIRETTTLGSGSANGIGIMGSGRGDEVVIENTEASGNDAYGIHIGFGEDVQTTELSGITAEDNGDTGVRVHSTAEGTLEINSATIRRSQRNLGIVAEEYGEGITVTGGQEVRIADSEVVQNGGANINIGNGEARGQSIEIRDTTATASGELSGIITHSSEGDDHHEFSNVEANSNAEYGLDIGGNSVLIENSVAEENEEGPYNFQEADSEDVTIRNSTEQQDISEQIDPARF